MTSPQGYITEGQGVTMRVGVIRWGVSFIMRWCGRVEHPSQGTPQVIDPTRAPWVKGSVARADRWRIRTARGRTARGEVHPLGGAGREFIQTFGYERVVCARGGLSVRVTERYTLRSIGEGPGVKRFSPLVRIEG